MKKYLLLSGFITQVFSLDSRNPGNAVRRIEEAPQKAISVVQATTSQVSTGSALPQEKLKLAYKLLGVSSQLTWVLIFRSSSMYWSFFNTFWQEVLDQGTSLPQDNSELDTLREQIKKVSSEKASLQEKNEKLSKAKKD